MAKEMKKWQGMRKLALATRMSRECGWHLVQQKNNIKIPNYFRGSRIENRKHKKKTILFTIHYKKKQNKLLKIKSW